MESKTLNGKEEVIEEAVISGIDSSTVIDVLNDVIDKTDEKGTVPKQVGDTIESIISMKSDIPNKENNLYKSDLLKNNSVRLTSAINHGITPDEVSSSLVNSLNTAETKKGKSHLRFITKLIFNMKNKELKKTAKKTESKGYQKIKI